MNDFKIGDLVTLRSGGLPMTIVKIRKRGLFLNGDEYRPADDGQYLALLREWSQHMRRAIDDGRIPPAFGQTLDHWYDRNFCRFGKPKTSGDDCHETIAIQVETLRHTGFAHIETVWAEKLWAIVVALKAITT
jgi:hypothetical protein